MNKYVGCDMDDVGNTSLCLMTVFQSEAIELTE